MKPQFMPCRNARFTSPATKGPGGRRGLYTRLPDYQNKFVSWFGAVSMNRKLNTIPELQFFSPKLQFLDVRSSQYLQNKNVDKYFSVSDIELCNGHIFSEFVHQLVASLSTQPEKVPMSHHLIHLYQFTGKGISSKRWHTYQKKKKEKGGMSHYIVQIESSRIRAGYEHESKA